MTTWVDCRLERCDVNIGRGSMFGNPFSHLAVSKARYRVATRDQSLDCYEVYFATRIRVDPVFRAAVLKLKGKVLGCYCKPQRCHGEIISRWLNSQP